MNTIMKLCRTVSKLPLPIPPFDTSTPEEAFEPLYNVADACRDAYVSGDVGYLTLEDIAYDCLPEKAAEILCFEIVMRLEEPDVELRPEDAAYLGIVEDVEIPAGFARLNV